MVFSVECGSWLSFNIDQTVLEEEVSWRDFGTGVRLGKLAREDGASLVLYECAEKVDEGAFAPHEHTGGEAYVVLEGEVVDENGVYPTGSVVWMQPGSKHAPETRGRTLILVLWPDGVKATS